MIGFIGVAYSGYLYDLRSYDICVERHYSLTDQYDFNTTLVEVFEHEMDASLGVTTKLKSSIITPYPLSSCGAEPVFLTVGVSDD